MKKIVATLAITLTAALTINSCANQTQDTQREIKTQTSDITAHLIENDETTPTCHITIDYKYLEPTDSQDTLATKINQTLLAATFNDHLALLQDTNKTTLNTKEGKDKDITENKDTKEDEGNNGDTNKALETIIDSYINNYRTTLAPDYTKGITEGWYNTDLAYMYNYEYDITTTLTRNSHNIYNHTAQIYEYTGGAHPNTTLHWTNIDATTGHTYTLDDIINPQNQAQVLSLIKAQLVTELSKRLENPALTTFDDLITNGILLIEDLHIPNNFILEDGAIRFLYNRYEIAPYALGDIQVTIPLTDIKPYLTLAL